MVTHKMLEILGIVARMPSGYRKLRVNVLKNEYEPYLNDCSAAHDAFLVLIGEKLIDGVDEEAQACYRSVIGSANKSVRSLAAR